MTKLLDLSYQLAYYKSYHMNSHNVNIHLYCIPLILSSAIVILSNFNLHWPLILCFSAYYIILDIPAGLIGSTYLFLIDILSNYLYSKFDNTLVIVISSIIHIVSWALQFYGHYHYEKRSPAVLDNLIQPLVLAPYFVIFEIFFMFGKRGELENRMMSRATELRLNNNNNNNNNTKK